MFAWLRKFGIGDPDAVAKTLNKDAASILEMVRSVHGAEVLKHIATIVRDARAEVHERATGNPEFYDTGLRALKDRNADARRRNDQATWSALTLTIIYLKAEVAGAMATPARAAIDAFLAEWQHAMDDEDGGAGPAAAQDEGGNGGSASA